MMKSVLVTGSGRGIGRGLALGFARLGHNLIISGRDREALGQVRRAIEQTGVTCKAVVGDLNAHSVLDSLEEVARNEDISILVNNAGRHCPHLPFEEMSDNEIDALVGSNLVSHLKLSRRIYSFFKDRKEGTIAVINSMSGRENHFRRTIYCASRWGLRGFTDTLRREAQENNVRIVGVYMARVKTRPEFSEGMEVDFVVKEILDYINSDRNEDLILDDRPNKKGLS